jgi:hypothetical protein
MNWTCARCGDEGGPIITSYFNMDALCFDCKAKEKEHPRYQAAVDAEVAACQRGDFNFPGIGLPDDLRA